MVALAERLRLELDSSDRKNPVGSQIIPDKSCRKQTHYPPSIPFDYFSNRAILRAGQIAATCAAARAHFLFLASLLHRG
jgi:hypothetical protein